MWFLSYIKLCLKCSEERCPYGPEMPKPWLEPPQVVLVGAGKELPTIWGNRCGVDPGVLDDAWRGKNPPVL